jgi:hypothetical protein
MINVNVVSIARQIATSMGSDWHATQGDYSANQDAYLRGPDGLAIHIEVITPAGGPRLVLSGHFDHRIHERAYRAPKTEITVSSIRPPDQIAADVRRRLIPYYQLALADAVERKLRTNEANAARDQFVAELAAALGTTVTERQTNRDDHVREVRIGRFNEGVHGEARVTGSAHDVKFTLNVPGAVAIRLAAHIAALCGESGGGHA